MRHPVYRFAIAERVSLAEAEMSLHLSMIAAEGLFSPAAVRLDFRYNADEPARSICVDASTAVGAAIVRVFTTLLTKEFGDDGFEVRRLPAPDTTHPASEGRVA